MKENKVDNYEPKIKIICMNCESPNISPYEIKDTTALKVGVKILVNLELARPSFEVLYHCKDCDGFSGYPIFHYQLTNQESTTR